MPFRIIYCKRLLCLWDTLRTKSDQVVNLDKEYLLGPSIEIQTLEADRVEFPFRPFDSSRIVILDEYDSGSCPYVYTYSDTTKAWHNEGVILRGNVGKHRESLAEKELRLFDGRILLKEVRLRKSHDTIC